MLTLRKSSRYKCLSTKNWRLRSGNAATDMRHSLGAIAVASTIVLAHGFVLPPPTGPFHVGSKAYVLPKITLNDPVAPSGTGTSLLLNLYYPTTHQSSPSKYVWTDLSTIYDTFYHLSNGTFGNLTARISHNAPPLPKKQWTALALPTLIFGPPFAGPPSQLFFNLFSDLASHGYTIISIDHPYEQPYLRLPNGTGIHGLPIDYPTDGPSGDAFQQLVHDYRLTDSSAVLDALPLISRHLSIPLNTTHTSFLGHSIGGAAALSQILHERARSSQPHHTPRILGALNLDGTLWLPGAADNSTADLRIPSLLLTTSGHRNLFDPKLAVFEKQQTSWHKEIQILGRTNHTDFADVLVVKQGVGISGGNGALSAERMFGISRAFVRGFEDFVAGRSGEGVLSGTEGVRGMWPEVEWVYNGTGPVPEE